MNSDNANPNQERPDPADVDSDLLIEATEAFIRALSAQDPAGGEQAAVNNAMQAEAMAPFDGPVVIEAVGFLRRLGYLSAGKAA